MRLIVPIIGVVLIAVRVVREELAGVQEIAVDLERLVGCVVDCVEIDREAWVGLKLGVGEDGEGSGGQEGRVKG